MQKPSPEQILAQQSAIARAMRQRFQVQRQQEEENRTQCSATVLGFDAITGLFRVQVEDGSVMMARPLTGSAGKGIGDVVSLYKPSQGLPVVKWL